MYNNYNNNYNRNNNNYNNRGNFMLQMMRFFAGRRGWDQFGFFLMIVSFLLEIVGSFVRIGALRINIIYWIGIALFIFCIFRMLSRNLAKREAENQAYLKVRNRIANWHYFRQMRKQQKKQEKYARRAGKSNMASADFSSGQKTGSVVYCYFYCPSCRQQVRVPSGKGKIKVTCPKCGTKFETAT